MDGLSDCGSTVARPIGTPARIMDTHPQPPPSLTPHPKHTHTHSLSHTTTAIRTMEVRQKHLEVRRVALPPIAFGAMEGRTAASVVNVFTGTGSGTAAGAGAAGGKEQGQEMDVAPAVAEEEEAEAEAEGEGEEEAVIGGKRKRGGQGQQQAEGRLVAKARAVMRGHTAFLTFAVRSLGGTGEGGAAAAGTEEVVAAPDA